MACQQRLLETLRQQPCGHNARMTQAHVFIRRAFLFLCGFATAGCATLPNTDALIARHAGQTARFESARGPLSERRNAAIVAQLKRSAGDIDILDKQIALEQEIVDSPLVVGNKVTLLRDGAQTYPAMFAAIRAATDHLRR